MTELLLSYVRASLASSSLTPATKSVGIAQHLLVMFAITQRPPVSALSFFVDEPSTSNTSHRYADPDPDSMDVDGYDQDVGEGPSRSTVVSPGEVITSAKEYMR